MYVTVSVRIRTRPVDYRYVIRSSEQTVKRVVGNEFLKTLLESSILTGFPSTTSRNYLQGISKLNLQLSCYVYASYKRGKVYIFIIISSTKWEISIIHPKKTKDNAQLFNMNPPPRPPARSHEQRERA